MDNTSHAYYRHHNQTEDKYNNEIDQMSSLLDDTSNRNMQENADKENIIYNKRLDNPSNIQNDF